MKWSRRDRNRDRNRDRDREAADYACRRPVRLMEWEDLEDGHVAVLRPKYGSRGFGRWLASRLRSPHCRVHLDDHGSFIWRHCDGRRSVAEIAAAMQAAHEDLGDLSERLPQFFGHMVRAGMVGWREPEAPPE